jgi:hypothetical protein
MDWRMSQDTDRSASWSKLGTQKRVARVQRKEDPVASEKGELTTIVEGG